MEEPIFAVVQPNALSVTRSGRALWLAEQRYVYISQLQVDHMSQLSQWVHFRVCAHGETHRWSRRINLDDGVSDDRLRAEDPPVNSLEEEKSHNVQGKSCISFALNYNLRSFISGLHNRGGD